MMIEGEGLMGVKIVNNFLRLGFTDEKYYRFPNIVNIEVFRGLCPCECVHCPVGCVTPDEREYRFGIHSMSMDLFRKILYEMEKYPHSTLRIHSVGEPILWPDLIPALSYLSLSPVKSWIFTSLVTNNNEILNALASYCDIIEVSINSTNRNDYISTKGIDAFDMVLNNLKYLSKYVRNNNLSTRIVVSRVQSDSSIEDGKFVRYWKETGLCDDAFVRKYHNYNNLLQEKNVVATSKVACLVHWMRFNIAYDGTVVVCFNELFHPMLRDDMILGNVNSDSIYNIWHDKVLNNIRNAEIHGYEGAGFALDFPCRNCFSCQSYDGKHETSECQIKAIK